MKRKHRRLVFVVAGMTSLLIAAGLVLNAFEDNLVFFYTPSDLVEKDITEGRRFRLGGLVEEGSVKRLADGLTVEFIVTDLVATVPVTYRGPLPDLFREGQGVVTEGKMAAGGLFIADSVLAKHDENYMPPEVAEALKASGQWQGDRTNNDR
ncbi:MAG: cytochrome c maturation protein CcmE [Proteobacteria bacterium]|nr:cytochrome c maturation protein CcmE [Pseudomonadota bacterium]